MITEILIVAAIWIVCGVITFGAIAAVLILRKAFGA